MESNLESGRVLQRPFKWTILSHPANENVGYCPVWASDSEIKANLRQPPELMLVAVAIVQTAAVSALAAKAHFSNRAFGSSSFHLLVSVLSGHLSLIRVTLLFAVIDGPVRLGRCTHVSDWTWSAPLCLALQVAQ